MEILSSCPICSASSLSSTHEVKDHSISKEVFTLGTCSSCGFVFTNPRPSSETIAPYYHSEDYISHSNKASSIQSKLYQYARTRAVKQKFRYISNYHTTGRLLDYGCGTGEFLSYISTRGFSVEGIEPELIAREQAIRNHGLSVSPNHHTVPANERFQIITLWHVLEHIHELRTMMKWFYSALHQEGFIFIAVPNRESWDAEYYGSDWAAYDVPRHLYHFRKQDIQSLFHNHGFELANTVSMKMDSLYISMLSEQYQGASKFSSLISGSINGIRSNFAANSNDRGTSSLLYIFRKSPL